MPPPSLHHGNRGIMKKGQRAYEKIRFWYEVSVKDGNKFPFGAGAALLECAGFIPGTIVAMVQCDINAGSTVAAVRLRSSPTSASKG